jgi:DNA-binding transcriptional regulator YiaG
VTPPVSRLDLPETTPVTSSPLRQYREALELSQPTFAALLGVPQAYSAVCSTGCPFRGFTCQTASTRLAHLNSSGALERYGTTLWTNFKRAPFRSDQGIRYIVPSSSILFSSGRQPEVRMTSRAALLEASVADLSFSLGRATHGRLRHSHHVSPFATESDASGGPDISTAALPQTWAARSGAAAALVAAMIPADYDRQIRAARERLGLSQAQFATAIGAARKAVVYRWEPRKRCPSPVFWLRFERLIASIG